MIRRTAAVILALLMGASVSGASPATDTAGERLWFGTAWYPEQWPKARWEHELALMEAAHITVVRINEFAWSTEEPSEDRYDFDWLAQAIALAGRHHIKVVIGTPTDAPPAWLTQKYPQVLLVDADGKPAEHGARRHFSPGSALYRKFSADIARRLAARFGHDPNVIGWQIGNEYSAESYDADTKHQFQDWLKARYKTLDALNEAWSTSYWSQTYSDWRQIPLNAKPGNPGLMLEHRRFVSDTWRDFQKAQLDAMCPLLSPKQFITTNVGGLGWSDVWDHYEINRDLDIASWDPYFGDGHLDADRLGAVSALVRGFKRRNYWVMEAQPAFVNWYPVNAPLSKAASRILAWESIGHGADSLLYWQWRSAPNGQEQYHGALLGADGEPNPFYDTAARIGGELQKASAALAGTHVVAQVAILHSYDSRWAIDFQLHNKNYDQLQVLVDTYRPLKDAAGAVDIVEPDAPLDRYKLVFAPDLNVIDDKLAAHLAAYVKAGGHLVLGPRAGMKDMVNRLNPQRQPGPLAGLLGGTVRQFYALDTEVPLAGDAGSGSGHIWAEDLENTAPDAKVLLRYGGHDDWLAGRPAAIARSQGQGRIVYLGALPDAELMRGFVRGEVMAADAAGPATPPDVEIDRRVGDGRAVWIVINHGDTARRVTLPQAMRDVLAGGETAALTVPPQDVAVLSSR